MPRQVSSEPTLLLRLGHWLVRWRWFVLASAVITVAMLSLWLPRLQVGFSIRGFFHSDDPVLQAATAHYQDGFETTDRLLLFGWPEADPLGAASLAALRQFEQSARQCEGVDKVFTLASAPVPGHLLSSPAERAASQTWRQLLVSKQRDAVGGVILLQRRGDDAAALQRTLQALQAAAAALGVELRLCGLPFHRSESTQMVRHDLATFLPLATAVAAVFLFWLIPHWALALLALLVVPITLVSTLATMAACDVSMTMVTSTLPTLLMCMSVADGVHLASRFLEERQSGHDSRGAAARTFEAMFVPCLMTSLTTILSFLSLCAAELQDLRQLGAFAALGMVFAFLVTMTCLPAAMSLVRSGPGRRPPDPAALLVRLSLACLRLRPSWPLLAMAVLVLSALPLGLSVPSDHRVTADLWPGSPVMQQLHWYEDRFVDVWPAEVLVTSPDGFGDAAVRAELTRLASEIERLPGNSRTLSLVDLWQDGLSPALTGGLSQLGMLPAGLLDKAATTARILVFRGDLGSVAWDAFVRQLRDLAAQAPHLTVRAAGLQVIATAQIERLVRDLLQSFGGSMLVIFLLVMVQCRSLRLGLCAMTACTLPLLLVLAFMALTGITLRPLTVISFCVAFGLMIDDAIHVVARYREERQQGKAPAAALPATLRSAGRPVVVTTMLLLVGFLSILGSSFKGTFSFGLLVTLALLGALLSAMLFLPSLIAVLDRPRARRQRSVGPP